jgi:Zn-dependent protease
MNFSLKIARLFGIEVRLHWTIIVFGAVLMLFPLPQTLEQSFWRFGLLLMIYGSVLLHEFGHSFAARFCDGASDRVVLWPLGGLAFVQLPENPVAHFFTALAGPLVSLAIWAAAFFGAPFTSGWVQHTLLGLAAFNGVILIFNLLPAYPLDGGRMLQAVLWRFMGYLRSMWVTVHVAMVLAVALLGAILFYSGTGYVPFMLVAAAVFIFINAWQERMMLSATFENREFFGSRPGVPWNHPYRTYKNDDDSFAPQSKGILSKLTSRPAPKKSDADEELDADAYISKEVDPILDKISKQGIQSLTEREKKILEKARQKMEKKSR